MCVRCNGFPLKTELDRRKWFAPKDHPGNSMDPFMYNHAQEHCKDENNRVPCRLQFFRAMDYDEENELHDRYRNTHEQYKYICTGHRYRKVTFVFHSALTTFFNSL